MLRCLTGIPALILPEYLIVTVLSALVAALLVGGSGWCIAFVAGITSLVMIGLNVLNNVFDIEIDRINKPARPLVTGALRPRTAICCGCLALGGSMLLACQVSATAVLFTALEVMLALAYSLPPLRIRRILFGAGFTAGLIYGMGPYLLAAIYSGVPAQWPLLALFFLLIFAIAPLKDIEDIAGDRLFNIRTLPSVMGTSFTLWFCVLVIGGANLLIIACATASFISRNNAVVGVLALIALAFFSRLFWRHPIGKKSILTHSRIVTGAMAFVMLIELAFGLANAR